MSVTCFLGSHLGVDILSITAGEGTVAPRLVSVVSTSSGTLQVTFSVAMMNEVEGHLDLPIPIFDPYNYLISEVGSANILRVLRVKKVSDTVYELLTNEQHAKQYALEIANVTDTYGNYLDPNYDSIIFLGTEPDFMAEAEDLHLFGGAYMGLGGFHVEDFIPDVEPPFLQNLIPAPGDTGLLRNTNIQFDLLDLGKGVNVDTVNITVNGHPVLVNGEQQAGYSVNLLTIPYGFRYTIVSHALWPEGDLVVVEVQASDLAYLPMTLDTSYSFATASTPPVLLNRNPEPGSRDVHLNRSIYFEVVDPDSGVNFSSIVIKVNDTVAFMNGTNMNQYRVGWSTIAGGFSLRIYSPSSLLLGINTVTVIADNLATYFATLNTTYSFFAQEMLALDIKTAWNQFDEHGLALALPRVRGETNSDYKRRLMTVMVDMANSAYRGLANGITRELGLSFFSPILINPRTDNEGNFLAPDPYICFDGVWLYMYSDYANKLLDYKIDRFQPGGNFEHIGRLVDFIQGTHYFNATLIGDTDRLTRSMTILNQSNRMHVDSEDVQASTRSGLRYRHIIPGSVEFDNKLVFRRQVSSASVITRQGDWHLDHQKGILTTASVPPGGTKVRYKYIVYPFKPIASPVILNDINNENFRVKMFRQILQDNGLCTHGAPTEIGVDVINELLTVVPMYWGL